MGTNETKFENRLLLKYYTWKEILRYHKKLEKYALFHVWLIQIYVKDDVCWN